MADNVSITPGTGAVIATDDVGGVQYQVVKLNVGGDGESLPLSPTNPMPVSTVVPPSSATANASGTIGAGGTAQNAAAANAARRGFWFYNASAGDLWINTIAVATASQPSLRIVAGAYYESPPGGAGTGALSVFGATTGQAFSGREW